MKSYRFKALLQNYGWLENATVTLDNSGKIFSVSQEQISDSTYIDGYALPGFQNAHSHAFQYAMAGLAEWHPSGAKADNFWSWREKMYELALNINPEQMLSIARMLYSELLRHGYTNVAEFHYLHHDKNGKPYENLALMGEALIQAARETGIKITLIPIFYQKGGFGKPPVERQKRFISATFEDYIKLFEASAKICRQYDGANVAVGIHSLRGVDAQDVLRTALEASQNVPFHIHVSEQLKEIEDSLAFLGKRPIEWLLGNLDLGERFQLVHATHLTNDEVERLAKTGANVVLCPSTEGNLGDGIFPLQSFQSYGGKWSIGTDSQIGLSFFEELRLLDYGQRLINHKRNIFTDQNSCDSGLAAITEAIIAGRRAMNNFENTFFAVGAFFDACIVKADEPLFSTVKPEHLASTIVYTADASQIHGTFVSGNLIQSQTRNPQVKEEFLRCVKQFRNF